MLTIYCIYDHPKDYPAHFVVRRWVGETPDKKALLCETIDEARRSLPPGLHRLNRHRHDDPCIVETWL